MFNSGKEIIPISLTITLLACIFIIFIIASLLHLKDRKIKKEHFLLAALKEERERTMYAISVEIHNNINQVLSLASMALSMIDKTAIPNQKKYISELKNMLDSVMAELRNISHYLNSDYLKERGLYESLQEELKWINSSKKINCDIEVNGLFKFFTQDTELIIIRIAQEVIQNTLKHAQAQKLHIDIKYGVEQFLMVISDDGKGFQYDESTSLKGMGLHSIQNRSRIINGKIEIKSALGKGTQITLVIAEPKYKEMSC